MFLYVFELRVTPTKRLRRESLAENFCLEKSANQLTCKELKFVNVSQNHSLAQNKFL
jgi:hypothetical protein